MPQEFSDPSYESPQENTAQLLIQQFKEQVVADFSAAYPDLLRRNPRIFHQLAGDQIARTVLVDHIQQTETLDQIITTIDALSIWLGDRDNDHSLHKDYRRNPGFPFPRIYTNQLRHALFNRILTSEWIQNLDSLNSITEHLTPMLLSREDGLGDFAIGFPTFVTGLLAKAHDKNPNAPYIITLLSALTDKGGINETMWGTEGIQRFNDNTPFAVTEELHRRFVIEKRDSYNMLIHPNRDSAAIHRRTITRYCCTLLRHIAGDETRNKHNVAKIANTLRLFSQDDIELDFREVINPANIITTAANQQGGVPNQDGRLQVLDALPNERIEVLGEALRRILFATRHANSPDYGQQEYKDSLHADIVHEFCIAGSNLPRALGVTAIHNASDEP